MFERSLLPTEGRSPRAAQAIAVSVAVQAIVFTVILFLPLLRPEALPVVHAALAPLRLTPKPILIKLEPLKPRPAPLSRTAPTNALHVPAPQQIATIRQGGMIQHAPLTAAPDAPATLALGNGLSDHFTLGSGPGADKGFGATPLAVVRAAPAAAARPTAPLHISTGVSRGNLLGEIRPVYPPIAIAAHVQGSVELTAIIDKQGRIVNLTVASGPEMLRASALAAVSAARYKPFLLNGEPTEVITTITVNFRMGY